MKVLERRCADVVRHAHQQVIGTSATGQKRSEESAAYPKLMAKTYASATRSAWLIGCRAAVEHVANRGMAVAIWLIFLCVTHGVFFTFEHPKTSRVWKLPAIMFLLSLESVFQVELDQCAWGKRAGDWSPDKGDVRVRKGTLI